MYRGNSSRANSPPRRHRCMTAGRDAPDAANTLKRDPPTVYPPSWALCPRSRALSWRVSAGDCSRASRAGPLASARAGPCTAATEPGAAAGGWELVRRVAHAAHPAPHMRAVPAALAGGHVSPSVIAGSIHNFQSAPCARGQTGGEAKRGVVHHLWGPATTSHTGWSTAAHPMHD